MGNLVRREMGVELDDVPLGYEKLKQMIEKIRKMKSIHLKKDSDFRLLLDSPIRPNNFNTADLFYNFPLPVTPEFIRNNNISLISKDENLFPIERNDSLIQDFVGKI